MEANGNPTNATRRDFLKTAGVLGAGLVASGAVSPAHAADAPRKVETLAMNGGPKAITAPAADATKWPIYGDEEIDLVTKLLRSPGYGPVAEFEDAWKAQFSSPFAKAHCNGTNALTSMLFACDYPEGSEIIVCDYSTWFPLVPMRLFGLVPVLVDANPRTMNIDLEAFKKAITPKTRAVLAVHWYGMPCDMEEIGAIAKEHGIDVLEDASHAHGAKVKDTWIGNWGRMAGFSLQSTKPLPAIEGGIAVYRERGDYERAVAYGNYDLPGSFPEDSPYRKYQGTAFGSKLRIHPVAAILARVQLRDLVKRNTEGVAQMKQLNDRITQLPGLTAQYEGPGIHRVYYSRNFLYVDAKQSGMSRDKVVEALTAEGMDVAAYTLKLQHEYPIYKEDKWWRHMPVLPTETPACDELNGKTLSLPYFTSAQPELVEQYAAAFEKVWAHKDSLGKA
jgi:dTDP-4-amino-4,6-dideoxygalactose transaminase